MVRSSEAKDVDQIMTVLLTRFSGFFLNRKVNYQVDMLAKIALKVVIKICIPFSNFF